MVNIYWHCRRRGLSSPLFPPVQHVQLEAETHPVTVGFSTVWQSLMTDVPRAFTQAAVYYRVHGIPSHRPFIPCCFGSSRATFSSNLRDYLFANILTLKFTSRSSPPIFHVKHDLILLLLNKINYPYVSFLGYPFVCLLKYPSTPASCTLSTEQQHNGYSVITPFVSSTHHYLSLPLAFNTLFLSRLPLFSPVVDVIHL